MADRIAIVLPFDDENLIPALRAVYDYNVAFLVANPQFPRLYDLHRAGRMRFAREPRRCTDVECTEERFVTIPVALAQGWGDCDDLAPWLAAERTVRDGIVSVPWCLPSRVGWHVIVLRDDGAREDPSAVMGME